MPVDTRNADYESNLATWTRNRDVVAGEDAVKAKGELYLPRLGKQTDPEYAAYKKRTTLFNAAARTEDGLVGLVFRKPPETIVPAAMSQHVKDIDLAGTSLEGLARKATREVVRVGRGGFLVEYPRAELRERTEDEAKAEGLRSYVTFWPAERILDWTEGRVNNRQMLTMVKLEESVEEQDPKDAWKRKSVAQIRVLRLTSEGVGVELYRKTEQGASMTEAWTLIDSFPLVIRNAALTEIPFVFCGPSACSPAVEKAPLTDLVLTNLSHYRTTADYENGLHWTGSPTPVFIGTFVTEPAPDGTNQPLEVKLGSNEGIHLAENGDAKFLEFSGDGLEGGLGKALERKENYMALLGARILAAEKRAAEAAETAAIHRAGENSVLATLALTVSGALTRALRMAAAWEGIAGEIRVTLNTDYLPTGLDSLQLTALVKAWQGGALSIGDLFYALKRGEIIRGDKTIEEHEAELEREAEARDEAAADALAATAKANKGAIL